VTEATLHDIAIIIAALGGASAAVVSWFNNRKLRVVDQQLGAVHLLVNDRLDRALEHIAAMEAAATGVPLQDQAASTYLRSAKENPP
jgi:hypothetical protein